MDENNEKCSNPIGEDFKGYCGENPENNSHSEENKEPEQERKIPEAGVETEEGSAEGFSPEKGEKPGEKIEDELALVKERLSTKEAQVEELLGRLQRLQADFENFRKRTQKEKEELTRTANASLMENLLPVIDNFARALQAKVGEEEAFRKGIEMIFRQLEKVLGDAGLEPIDSLGRLFDPNIHQAVFMVEDDTCEENTVVEELQKGYVLGGKVLRPAMVKVSRKSAG